MKYVKEVMDIDVGQYKKEQLHYIVLKSKRLGKPFNLDELIQMSRKELRRLNTKLYRELFPTKRSALQKKSSGKRS